MWAPLPLLRSSRPPPTTKDKHEIGSFRYIMWKGGGGGDAVIDPTLLPLLFKACIAKRVFVVLLIGVVQKYEENLLEPMF